MAIKKVKRSLGPTPGRPKEFKCTAEDAGEEEIILLFKDMPDRARFDVIKLERTGLPATYNNQTVDWIGNFGIKDKQNGRYADMTYTVIITPRENQTLVCFNGETEQFEPVETTPAPAEYPGKIAFNLTIGDPGAGWVT